MKDLLIKTLEILEFPIFQQGNLGKDETYPESFFTFWNNETENNSFYDNKANSCVWDFDLNFYSSNPELVNTTLLKAVELLQEKGFIANGKGHDVASDEITHTGRGINILKIERMKI